MFNTYLFRLIIRILVLIGGCILFFRAPNLLEITSIDFFSKPSLLHIVWVYLLVIILFSLFPKAKVSVGSLKYLKKYYKSVDCNVAELKAYKKKMDHKALIIAIVWVLFNTPFWILYLQGFISSKILLLLVLLFAVADIICVLFFCPFQLFLRNKCCTTCRIFVWDHILMVFPLVPVVGFFSWSLIIISLFFLVVWETSWHRHPEYFWENSNQTLKCSSCSDRLCKVKRSIY